METYITSPCKKICSYFSKDLPICKGCGRTDDEIRHWMDYSNDQKKLVIKNSRKRLKIYAKNLSRRASR